jgi:hypothetical protein
MKAKKGLFPELHYDSSKIELTGIESVEGKDAYVLVITTDSGKTTNYYDVASGLKVKKSETAKGPGGQEVVQDTSYGDYKEVDGIKFPYKMIAPAAGQKIEFTTINVKVNTPLTKADFE